MGDEGVQSTLDILESLHKDIESMRNAIEEEKKEDERLKLRYPFPSYSSWGQGKVAISSELKTADIPEELTNSDDQPVIMDFKSVMQTLQKTIAMEHAKKVREGKESVNMNGILRVKYSEDNYYFPDRILNSGLCKKDFTAPFLIDVKLINQDCGKVRDDKKKVSTTKADQEPVEGREESRKRKDIQNYDAEALICTPTLYAMLEPQSGIKRLRVGDQGVSVKPPTKPVTLEQQDNNNTKSVPSILAKTLSSTVSVSRVTRSSVPTATVNQQVLNGNGFTAIMSANHQAVLPSRGRQPVAIKPKPDPTQTQYVSIRPKLPITVITPEKSILKNQQTVTGKVDSDKDQDDDFSPKIVNTQGSVILTKAAVEPLNQANGVASINKTSPPNSQMLKIQPRRTYENTARVPNCAPKVSSVRGSGFLGCKTCGKTFPSNCDNLYRNHMIIKHSKEVTDSEILEAKIQVTSWYKCKKCSLMVLNNLEEHNRRCSPEIPFSKSFDAIQVLNDDVPKLQCGICPEAVESRVHLRAHLSEQHPEICNKVLLDPNYRCGVCLLLFSDTSKLITHVSTCMSTTPTLETAQELAQKNLHCEICCKKHSKIRETLFCYQVKTLLRSVGLCCPFCNDDVEKPTRQAFDHFIDNHYNVALKRAGEAALVRGRIQLQAQAAASRSAAAAAGGGYVGSNNNVNRSMTRLTRPVVQQRRSMPLLRPKTVIPPPVQQQTISSAVGGVRPTGVNPQGIRVSASQVLKMNSPNLNMANAVIGNNSYPPGTVLTARPIIINNRGIPQIPLGFTVVPATNIQTSISGNSLPVTTVESMDTSTTTTNAAEDSILDV
ncbi:unnamed protein product [Allacma fusca]|uniref:C2H2-type domain-containing protein n=1 Tax=Allacma fusca TaxID=39272 RepID=A0A8J2KLE4_9HEXA|nr:unnamed protein product [Allacma fusca]